MVEKVQISPTEDSPLILLDKDAGVFQIIGNSYSGHTFEKFEPALIFFEQYSQEPNEQTILVLKLQNINSSTHKILTEILKRMKQVYQKSGNAKVEWHYDSSDTDSLEEGKHYAQFFDFEFVFFPY